MGSGDSPWRGHFLIEELMISFQLEHCFHIENDNLIYCRLNELLPLMKAYYPGIAATFDNDDRCVPGFMYFGSAQAATSLTKFLTLESSRSSRNDMELIADYRKVSDPGKIDSLPIVPEGLVSEWVTSSGKRSVHPEIYTNHAKEFKSVFDAAAIGQYLGGVDPRNARNNITIGFINESCVFDPSQFKYEWTVVDDRGRLPFLSYKGIDARINNLHIHSKLLRDFRS